MFRMFFCCLGIHQDVINVNDHELFQFFMEDWIHESYECWRGITQLKWHHQDFIWAIPCHNPSFGFTTKARACKGASQEWSPWVTFYAPRNVGKCEGMNHTFPNELPLWELESRWTLEFSKGDSRHQKSLDWKNIYTNENILELRCLKWAHMTHLGT